MGSSEWVPPTPEQRAESVAKLRALAAEQHANNNRLAELLVQLASDSTPSDFLAALDEMGTDAEEAADALEDSDQANNPEVRALALRLRNQSQAMSEDGPR